MSLRRRTLAALTLVVSLVAADHAHAIDGPLLLFGGPNHDEFLGCLNCYRSEPFSVWNANGEYGDPGNENSIWNQAGPYGSRRSPLSPWNPRSSKPPLVVDRVGNLYGYFTLNRSYPMRIRRNDSHPYWADFQLLVRLLDEYEWIVTHLDEERAKY